MIRQRTRKSFKWRRQTRPFKVKHPGNYAHYKLEIIENSGGDSTSLAEIELLDDHYNSPKNISDIKNLVDQLKEQGAFKNNEAVKVLKRHLVAVEHYAKQERAQKVTKHLTGFLTLLDHQKKDQLISEVAYGVLKTNSDKLIKKWESK